jgi:predicted GNAT superfamily acetyltransferase
MQARNAHFNLNRLGATVETYLANFYGTDYSVDASLTERIGLPSDRLSATWNIDSDRVQKLAQGEVVATDGEPVMTVAIPSQWNLLVKQEPRRAVEEQARVREEFQEAFGRGLVCKGFQRDQDESRYLLFER